jgi:hypothetical protein
VKLQRWWVISDWGATGWVVFGGMWKWGEGGGGCDGRGKSRHRNDKVLSSLRVDGNLVNATYLLPFTLSPYPWFKCCVVVPQALVL